MESALNARACLVILDGWGINHDPKVSAIEAARTPYYDSLCKKYAKATLVTYGEDVGLPEGQMGNSEVGHLNIGAGRIVFQELARINNAIKDGSFSKHPVMNQAFKEASETKKVVHLMGLVSDGGVHSHIDHLKAICDVLIQDYPDVMAYIHAFTDGRDVSPTSGKGFIEELEEHISGSNVRLATIIGRYYAMDRDKRWERTSKAYDLLVKGDGAKATDMVAAIQQSYDNGVTDEFILPICRVSEDGEPITTISEGDTILFFNFRTDRPRQLVYALTQAHEMQEVIPPIDVDMYTMTAYDDTFEGIRILFATEHLNMTIGELMASLGKSQVRIAETEKYPHVTFFFSGGREKAFENEKRILVPSPKVATYDLQPEMSAPEVTDKLMKEVQDAHPDFICINYANTDMVGHTGVFDAAVKAAETVDDCLSRLVPLLLDKDYGVIIIADHGNSDIMINPDGSPHTAHTKNLVNILFATAAGGDFTLQDGILADVAPTLLRILGIDVPEEMTGTNLIGIS